MEWRRSAGWLCSRGSILHLLATLLRVTAGAGSRSLAIGGVACALVDRGEMGGNTCRSHRGRAQAVKHRRELEAHNEQREIKGSRRFALPSQRPARKALVDRGHVRPATD